MTTRPKGTGAGKFSPIRVERVPEKVAGQLKQLIADGALKVGDRLPGERDLAEQLGVSRTSVREALQQLEIQGILETIHGGGSVIRNITAQEMRTPIEIFLEADRRRVLELTELRAFMEAWAARQAALNRTEAEVELIRGCLEEMERDLEKNQVGYDIDFKYHLGIAAATHNTLYLHLIDNIYHLVNFSIKVHREEVFAGRNDQERILNHHRRIFNAIRAGDPDAAEAAMREHLAFVIEEFKRKFYAPLAPAAGP